jgi:hypothetical protein
MAGKFFQKRIFTCLFIICFCGLMLGGITASVQAQDIPENESCLACHDQPDWEWKLANGDILNLSVSGQVFNQSVHQNMQCIECHIGYEDFPAPHNQITATNKRQYMVSYHDTCQKCHSEQFNQVSGNVHEELYQAGNLATPICADCHQPHSQLHMSEIDQPRESGQISWKSQTCADCHEEDFENYTDSVHGAGLVEGNDDMPECVDCHHVHQICDPGQNNFRKESVDTCAKCHTNNDIMTKYGLETNVLDTYMVFHDTTVTLTEDYNPDSLTNKPTCYDCHGIHEVGNITPPPIQANISAMTLYPEVEVKKAGPPVENVGITGLVIGLILGIVGTLTIKALIIEKREEINSEGTKS